MEHSEIEEAIEALETVRQHDRQWAKLCGFFFALGLVIGLLLPF